MHIYRTTRRDDVREIYIGYRQPRNGNIQNQMQKKTLQDESMRESKAKQ